MANRPRGNVLPVDPDVNIPKAVRDAAAAADAHYQPPAPEPAPEPSEGVQIANPPPEPAPQPPAPEPAPPVTPPGNDRFPPVESASAEEWRSRFISENGRYRAKLRAIEAHEQTINGLQNIIDDMREQLTTRPAPTPEPTPQQNLITDKEKEDFGSEMLDVVGRRAVEVLNPELATLRAQVADMAKQLRGTVKTVQANTEKELVASLAAEVPNWREINFDDKFKSWLALPDPYSGAIRQKLLNDAFEQKRTPQVIAFFKGFLSEEAALDPQPTPTVPAPVQPSKPGLEQFAAPGRARTPASGSPLPVEKPIIYTSQITAFYNLVRAGGYAGKEEEKDSLEREIFAAQKDGRVRTG